MIDKNNSKVNGISILKNNKSDIFVLDKALEVGLISYIKTCDVSFDKIIKLMLSNVKKYSIALEVYYDYLKSVECVSNYDLLLDNLYFGLINKKDNEKRKRR